MGKHGNNITELIEELVGQASSKDEAGPAHCRPPDPDPYPKNPSPPPISQSVNHESGEEGDGGGASEAENQEDSMEVSMQYNEAAGAQALTFGVHPQF